MKNKKGRYTDKLFSGGLDSHTPVCYTDLCFFLFIFFIIEPKASTLVSLKDILLCVTKRKQIDVGTSLIFIRSPNKGQTIR